MSCNNPEIAEELGRYELGLLDDQERSRVRAHLLECQHCFEELYRMQPAAELMRAGEGAPGPSGEAADTGEPPAPLPLGHLGQRRLRRRLWLGAGLAAALAMVTFLALPDRQQPLRRGGGQGSVVALWPIGEVERPRELDWKVVPGANEYELRLLEQDGSVLWQQTVEEPPAELPQQLSVGLQPGRSYFWEVTARGAKDERWTSRPIRFELRK